MNKTSHTRHTRVFDNATSKIQLKTTCMRSSPPRDWSTLRSKMSLALHPCTTQQLPPEYHGMPQEQMPR